MVIEDGLLSHTPSNCLLRHSTMVHCRLIFHDQFQKIGAIKKVLQDVVMFPHIPPPPPHENDIFTFCFPIL